MNDILFGNNNKAIIKKLARAGAKTNRLKNRLSLLAIALATVLMVSVLLLMVGVANMTNNQNNTAVGSYHAMSTGVTEAQFRRMGEDERVEAAAVTASVGHSKSGGVQLNASYSDAAGLRLCGLAVEEGEMPTAENEILIEKDYLKRLGLAAQIGDRIFLELAFDYAADGQSYAGEFVVSGFLKTSATGTNRSLFGAVVSEKFFSAHGGWQAAPLSVVFRMAGVAAMNDEQIKQTAAGIAADAAITGKPFIHTAYLRLLKPSFAMVAAAGAALIIIAAAGALVIYCIFYIAVVNHTKEYGQLRTIGMTGKQIRQLVFKESKMLLLRAVPAGLLLGTLFAYALIPKGFAPVSLLWAWPTVVVLVCLTVLASVIQPAKIAAAVSPIEATRLNAPGEKPRKTRPTLKKLSPATLAWAQLGRNRKKSVLSAVSLALTGVLLLSISAVLASVDAEAMAKQGFPEGQYVFTISSDELRASPLEQIQAANPLTDQLYNTIAAVPGVEQIKTYEALPVAINEHAQESDLWVLAFDMQQLARYAEAADVPLPSYSELTAQNGLVVGRPDSFEQEYGFRPQVGQVLPLKVYDGGKSRTVEFTVAAVLDEAKAKKATNADMLMLPAAALPALVSANIRFDFIVRIETGAAAVQQTDGVMEQIVSDHPGVELRMLSAAIAQNENMIQGLRLGLMVVVVFIGCFALMSLANTIWTGIITRQKEFAMMRSVGMSGAQLKKMVQQEGLLTVAAGLVLSVVCGSALGAVLCRVLQQSAMSYLEYSFPLAITAAFCAVVLLITVAITHIALKGLAKVPLVEQLK